MNTEQYTEHTFEQAIEQGTGELLGLSFDGSDIIHQAIENFRTENKKTYTLRLKEKSVNTIKRFSEKNGMKYQTYLSNFIDEIAEKMEKIETLQKH